MPDKVALVTGGSTGIGAAIALKLAEENYQVTITGRHENSLQKSAARHDKISYIVANVSKSEDIKQTLEHIKNNYGRLDLLVNNAGTAPPVPIEQVTLEHFDMVFNTNVRGLVDMTINALPLLKTSKGNIINISSIVGDRPLPNFSIYSATKGAVNTLTSAWAKELAVDGIRVNAISPGPIDTPLFNKMDMTDEQKADMADAINRMVPLGRFGNADDIASAALYLASADAGYITGVQFKVDGGFSA